MSKDIPIAHAEAIPAPTAGEATPLKGDNTTFTTTPLADPNAPRGTWRDGLCGCCDLGPCHPSLWNAICCPQILMAQVLTRMNMTWLAVRTNSTLSRNTFRNVIMLLIVYWIASTCLAPPEPQVIQQGEDFVLIPGEYSPLKALLYNLVTWGFMLYTLIVMMKLRRAIRERYSIPGNGCEDCCCVMFCGCCTVSQMARHTADYGERRALCCSTTGLPPTQEMYTAMVV